MNDYWLAVLLGIVEGLTEFLPISSTGHLLLAQHLLEVPLDKDPYWKMFTVVIQLGAILAVVVYYQRRLRELIGDFLAASSKYHVPRWRHPLVLVLLAVVPAGLIGILAKKRIDELMEHALPIGIAFLVGGILIELIERACRGRGWIHDAADVSPGQAIGIGVAQAVALIPGSSRSACTIMGGRLLGLDMRAAADFSFLLSIPTMFAAAFYSLYKHHVPLDAHQWGVLAVGFVVSFLVAWPVVAWFLHYLKTHSFRLFVVYRIVVGVAVIVAVWRGYLP
ncbi:MAG TPA: undecaprenyl-diphosphate phosphatase [Gemmataceae bacterium]|nr:undecaprenyl-diphosphate phosphatase [Gemmataceae bacterium]